jgi:hypothetical protein
MLTAVVTLTVFVLGSVGVASAGMVEEINLLTRMEGKFKKGKEWCGTFLGQRVGDENADSEKIKEDFSMWIEFSDFPDVTAVIRTTGIPDVTVDGLGVRKNDKKGFFSVGSVINDGFVDAADEDWASLSMEGTYKANSTGIPTSVKGTFHAFNAVGLGLDVDDNQLVGPVCVTNNGQFNAKGDGNAIVLPGFPVIDP